MLRLRSQRDGFLNSCCLVLVKILGDGGHLGEWGEGFVTGLVAGSLWL